MQINEQSLTRLTHSRMNGANVATIFKLLAQAAEIAPKDATLSMTLRFQQPEDEVKEDDLFPSITLSLQPSSSFSPVIDDGNTSATDNANPT